MLNSAERCEVAWLSRILTILLKSFHMFSVPCASLCFPVTESVSSMQPNCFSHPLSPLWSIPWSAKQLEKSDQAPNKTKCLHYGGAEWKFAIFTVFNSMYFSFPLSWRSRFSEGWFEQKNLTPRKVCTTGVYNSSTSPDPRATSHLSASHTSQPQMILFDKQDKGRKVDGTVQCIHGACSRTEEKRSRTKEIQESLWGPDNKTKIYQKFRQETFPLSVSPPDVYSEEIIGGARFCETQRKSLLFSH